MKQYKLKKSFINEMRSSRRDSETAKMLNCHPSTVSLFFSGKRAPSKNFIIKICTKMNLFPSEFLKIQRKEVNSNGKV